MGVCMGACSRVERPGQEVDSQDKKQIEEHLKDQDILDQHENHPTTENEGHDNGEVGGKESEKV
jgi:hypothetical protein